MQPDLTFDAAACVSIPSESGPREVRCAVRFPLALPAMLSVAGDEVAALTRDISSSGVLFELDRLLEPGTELRFALRMPRSVLGAPHDVLVHCIGRVVRCSMSQSKFFAASTIDEYEFAEQ